MDLDLAKSVDAKTLFWARLGMLVCFAVAAGILIVSLAAPSPARAAHPGAGLSSNVDPGSPLPTRVFAPSLR
jgi:hypothetical protein